MPANRSFFVPRFANAILIGADSQGLHGFLPVSKPGRPTRRIQVGFVSSFVPATIGACPRRALIERQRPNRANRFLPVSRGPPSAAASRRQKAANWC